MNDDVVIALVSGALGTVLGTALGSLLNHVLSGRARRDERAHSAQLRQEQEERDARLKREEERVNTFRTLRALLTELQLNEQALREWTDYLGWDITSDPGRAEPVRPVSLFEFVAFQNSRSEVALLPINVRNPVVTTFAKARQFQALTQRHANSSSPDIDLMLAVARGLISPLNVSIQELSYYLDTEQPEEPQDAEHIDTAEKSPESPKSV